MDRMNNSIEHAAQAAHEINRIYCESHGDLSQPRWADAPDWQKDSARSGVKGVIQHPEMTPEQGHEGWLAEKRESGWTYGDQKNPDAKTHPCMVPYSELPEAQRFKDELFGTVVRAALGIPLIG